MKRRLNNPILKNNNYEYSSPISSSTKKLRFALIATALSLLFIATPILVSHYNNNFINTKTTDEIHLMEKYLGYDVSSMLTDENIETPFRANKNGINLVFDENPFGNYKNSFIWAQNYLNNIFQIINPDISFNITNATEKFNNDSSIAFSFKDLNSDNNLAKTNAQVKFTANKAEVTRGDIFFDSCDKELLDQNQFITRATILHEILHALGVPHISQTEGGNIMQENVCDVGPLILSTNEIKALTVLYGNNENVEFYDQFLTWYENKYNQMENNAKYVGLNMFNKIDDNDIKLIEQCTFNPTDFNNYIYQQNEDAQ